MTSGANEQSQNVEHVAVQAAEEVLGPNPFVGLRPADIFAVLSEIGEQALKAPLATLQQEAGLVRALFSVLTGTADIAPAKGDKRFADPAWNDNPFYRSYLQGYLTWTNALDSFIETTGLDSVARQRARFVMSLLAELGGAHQHPARQPRGSQEGDRTSGVRACWKVRRISSRTSRVTAACRPRLT